MALAPSDEPTPGAFLAAATRRPLAPDVLEAARQAVADWFAVALGAAREPTTAAVRRAAASFAASGRAAVVLGSPSAEPVAALVNGTMAHVLDFDDTHPASGVHVTAPAWAAVFALATAEGRSGAEALAAFAAGYELAARLGAAGDLGAALLRRRFHPTGVLGRIAAAGAAAALLGLEPEAAEHALALAATMAGGLTGSFGTMAKPLHAGQAALDGVVAARLASVGFQGARRLLEPGGGLVAALVQDGSVRQEPLRLTAGQALLENEIKPYACGKGVHPFVAAGLLLAPGLAGRAVARIRVSVHPDAPRVEGIRHPRTAMEAKFSLSFCLASALLGSPMMPEDFTQRRLEAPQVRALMALVEVARDAGRPAPAAAHLQVTLADGSSLGAEVRLDREPAAGPMPWADLAAKFDRLVRPVLGERTDALFEALRQLDRPGRLARVAALVGAPSGP